MTDAPADTHERESDPLISVIMPCFNAAPYVEEAIESVLGQTYRNVELVVVDDGSTDGSDAIVAALVAANPERVNIAYTSRVGPYPARNAGLERAHGVLIAFLDADDWWLPDALEKLHAAVASEVTS